MARLIVDVASGAANRRFGRKSKAEMHMVHPECIAWAYVALMTAPYDLSFFDGARTKKQQEANLQRGVSWSENSYHVPLFPGGYSDACDLVPYVDGLNTWEWQYVYANARSVIAAALSLGIDGKWGGVWDRHFSDLDLDDLPGEVQRYVARRRARGLKSNPDGCHFQRKSRTRSLQGLAE